MAKKYRFQVLQGRHAEGYYTDENGQNKQKIYRRGGPLGDVIETEKDLAKMFNKPGCIKFRKLSEGETVEEGDDYTSDLDAMSITALRELASSEGIDLGSARKKQDIIDIIRIATDGTDEE